MIVLKTKSQHSGKEIVVVINTHKDRAVVVAEGDTYEYVLHNAEIGRESALLDSIITTYLTYDRTIKEIDFLAEKKQNT